jgi:hypothetical protein
LAQGPDRKFAGQPTCWKNYIEFIKKFQYDILYDIDLNLKFVNYTTGDLITYFLKFEFNAIILPGSDTPIEPPQHYYSYVKFGTLDDYTLFMLKFG